MFKKPVWDDLSFVTWCIILLEVASEDVYTVVIKGWPQSATMLRYAVAFKRRSIGTKNPKVCQENIPPHHYTTTTSLNHWDKTEWIHAFMLFTPNSDPTIWMSQQKSRLIRQATFFQSSIVQFWWSCVNCSLRVLFLADRSGTRCDLLLL